MRTKAYSLILLTVALFAALAAAKEQEDSALAREYQVKAAFLYNFIKFVDWPEEKMGEPNDPIIIGIIGSKDFIKAFEPVKHKQIGKKNVVVKYFEGFEKKKESKEKNNSEWNRRIEAIKKCHVLLFCTCDSEQIENPGRIIKALQGSSLLTVGETPGFLEMGGMINLVLEEKKLRFEINVSAAKRAKLTMRSQLVRLAKRVVKEESSEEAEN